MRTRIYALLAVLCAVALLEIFARGHWSLAGILVVVCFLVCWNSRSDSRVGLHIACVDGSWAFGRAGALCAARLGHHALVLPWAVFASLKSVTDGSILQLWIFSDSVPADDFRRLRVQLNITS